MLTFHYEEHTKINEGRESYLPHTQASEENQDLSSCQVQNTGSDPPTLEGRREDDFISGLLWMPAPKQKEPAHDDQNSISTNATPKKKFLSDLEVDQELFQQALDEARYVQKKMRDIRKFQALKVIDANIPESYFFLFHNVHIEVDDLLETAELKIQKPIDLEPLNMKLVKKEKKEDAPFKTIFKGFDQKGCQRGRKKRKYADELDPDQKMEPWWFQNKKDNFFELLASYKYLKWINRNSRSLTIIIRRKPMQGATLRRGKKMYSSLLQEQMHGLEDKLPKMQRFSSVCLQSSLMTVHSHIHRNEVIGFLSGHKISTKQGQKDVLIIQECFPCQASEITDNQNIDYSKNVELDPESASIKIEQIQQKNQLVLGWYHSHPKFEVNPSHVDVINHESYQLLFNKDLCQFVGIIISPYYSTQDTPQKLNSIPKLRCFVNMRNSDSSIPYEICLNVLPQAKIRELEENPFAIDKINMRNETCVIKTRKNQQVHLKKGEKMLRSIRQLLEMNVEKLRSKVSACFVARHLGGLIMMRMKLEQVKKEEKKIKPKQMIKREEEEDEEDSDMQRLDKEEESKEGVEVKQEVGIKEEQEMKEEQDIKEGQDIKIEPEMKEEYDGKPEDKEEEEEEEKGDLLEDDAKKSKNLKKIVSFADVHAHLSLTISQMNSPYFQQIGKLEEYCEDISKLGKCEQFVEELRQIFRLGDDTYYSDDDTID